MFLPRTSSRTGCYWGEWLDGVLAGMKGEECVVFVGSSSRKTKKKRDFLKGRGVRVTNQKEVAVCVSQLTMLKDVHRVKVMSGCKNLQVVEKESNSTTKRKRRRRADDSSATDCDDDCHQNTRRSRRLQYTRSGLPDIDKHKKDIGAANSYGNFGSAKDKNCNIGKKGEQILCSSNTVF